jgi:hypothetical protein
MMLVKAAEGRVVGFDFVEWLVVVVVAVAS